MGAPAEAVCQGTEEKIVTTYYKWLQSGRRAPIGIGEWPPPGEWWSVNGALVPCQNGLHVCEPDDLVNYMSQRLWTVEIDSSELIRCNDKTVVRRARLLDPVKTINFKTFVLFALDCASRVVHLANDKRSESSIEVARKFAHGQATREELEAAGKAARRAVNEARMATAATYISDVIRDKEWAAAAAEAAAWAARPGAEAAGAEEAARKARGFRMSWAERIAQSRRLLQYARYGEAAEHMPWGE